MNREEAKKLLSNLPIVQAFAEGKDVQIRIANTRDKWENISEPNFYVAGCEYRVKPSPALLYAVCRKNGTAVHRYENEQTAKDQLDMFNTDPSILCSEHRPYFIRAYREVLPEET